MRHWYLKKANYKGGCRGGIASNNSDDYALEIGQDQFANPDLFAVAILHDEIVEFLELYRSKSPWAAELYASYRKLKEEIEESLRAKE